MQLTTGTVPVVSSFLKPLLVQAANALIHSNKHPEFTERYRRIKASRGHKKAIIGIVTKGWMYEMAPSNSHSTNYLPDNSIRDYYIHKTAFRHPLLHSRSNFG